MALVGCNSGNGSRTLAVSVEPQRALLQEITGDRFEITTLLANGANPETYDPSMKTRMAVENSAAYFTTGAMPFEKTIAEALPASVTVVDCSTGIEPIYGTHSHDHSHGHNHNHSHGHSHDSKGEPDPHVWASVKNARVVAHNMLDAVIALDPDGKDYYTERYNRLDARLDSLDKAIAAKAAAGAQAFAVWHPSLSYFARDYGLEQIAVGFENKEMSPKHLAEVVEQAKAKGVKVFFFQKEYDSRQAETLNNQMGTRLVTINPLAYDWEAQLTAVADALAQP